MRKKGLVEHRFKLFSSWWTFFISLIKIDDEVGIVENLEIKAGYLPRAVVVADDITDFLDLLRGKAKLNQDGPCDRWPFNLLIFPGAAAVLSLGLMDTDIVEHGSPDDDGVIAPLPPPEFLSVFGYPAGVADSPLVSLEVARHLSKQLFPVVSNFSPLKQVREHQPPAVTDNFQLISLHRNRGLDVTPETDGDIG